MVAFDSTSFADIERKIAGFRASILAALSFPVPECVEQVLDRPVRSLGGKQIGGGAVLPDAAAEGGGRIGLQLRLGH
jgi:hypothetical protein